MLNWGSWRGRTTVISNSGKTLTAPVYLWFSVVCKLLAVARQVSRAAVDMLSTGGSVSSQTMLKPAVKATGSTHSSFLSGNSLRSLILQCSAPNPTRQVSDIAKASGFSVFLSVWRMLYLTVHFRWYPCLGTEVLVLG